MTKKVWVGGAGGMIGGYLVKRLLEEGHEVWAADIKPKRDWLQWHRGAKNFPDMDLSIYTRARYTMPAQADEIYMLCADMGGIGWIEHNPWVCVSTVKTSMSVIEAAIDTEAKRLFFSSSACAYPVEIQRDVDVPALKESDAWKGRAEYGYGEEKLFTESLCEIAPIEARIARYHNIYAPAYTTFKGGREKAPAAICRKVAEAVISGSNTIDIWGDGTQTRSFCYIDDCVEGTIKIMRSDYNKPLNLGSDELVTINQLVDIVEEIALVTLKRTYDLDAPQGVKGRNSDNTLIKEVLDWAPSIKLRDGLEQTYEWIYNEVKNGK